MTRSNTPGTAGAGNSNEDYSVSATPADALGVDSLDDDFGGDALAASGAKGATATAPTVPGRAADETPLTVGRGTRAAGLI